MNDLVSETPVEQAPETVRRAVADGVLEITTTEERFTIQSEEDLGGTAG